MFNGGPTASSALGRGVWCDRLWIRLMPIRDIHLERMAGFPSGDRLGLYGVFDIDPDSPPTLELSREQNHRCVVFTQHILRHSHSLVAIAFSTRERSFVNHPQKVLNCLKELINTIKVLPRKVLLYCPTEKEVPLSQIRTLGRMVHSFESEITQTNLDPLCIVNRCIVKMGHDSSSV
jgi:hypothetical protein